MILKKKEIANTYAHPSVQDAWEIVKQYREVSRYPEDAGSTAVARDLEIPRGRVRPWLNDSKPDAVHAIDFATDHGWLDNEWTLVTKALSRVIACLFAAGTIREQGLVPSWTPSENLTRRQLQNDLQVLGVGWQRAHDDSNHQTTEIRPVERSSILGRALIAAGGPVGAKHESATTLPAYLDNASVSVRAEWAEWYVRERAIQHDQKATRHIQVDRPASFYKQVVTLIETVTGASVTQSDSRLIISAAAVRALGLA